MTPADDQKIRAYFNAGVLVVRPERGILQGWGESFSVLCQDPELKKMCEADETWRIFIHQAALVGPPILELQREEMKQLPDSYNYPMFFKKQYGANREFDDISDIVTMRYDVYFRDPEPDWTEKLKGPKRKLDWLKDHLR